MVKCWPLEKRSHEINASLPVGGKEHLQILEIDDPCLLRGQAKGSSKILQRRNLIFSLGSFASAPGASNRVVPSGPQFLHL